MFSSSLSESIIQSFSFIFNHKYSRNIILFFVIYLQSVIFRHISSLKPSCRNIFFSLIRSRQKRKRGFLTSPFPLRCFQIFCFYPVPIDLKLIGSCFKKDFCTFLSIPFCHFLKNSSLDRVCIHCFFDRQI